MPRKSGGQGGGQASQSKRIAMGGLFTALAVMVMLLGGLVPIGTFAAPIFAGLCLIPVIHELGRKTALVAYAAIGLLSFFVVPDKELVLFFLLLFGYYPILYPTLGRIRSKVLRYGAKMLLFNVAAIGAYVLFYTLFASPAMLEEFLQEAWWLNLGLLLVGNATFVLYDILVDKFRIIYVWRIRKMIFR